MKRQTIASLTAQLKAQGQLLLDVKKELDARSNLERKNAQSDMIRETERASDLRDLAAASPMTTMRDESPFGARVKEPSLFDVVRTIEENREIIQKNISSLAIDIDEAIREARDGSPKADYEIVHEGSYYVDVEGVRVLSDSPMKVVNRR